MSCEDVKARLDDYVDGTLPERELHELELHIASCAECRDEERRLRAVLAHAAAMPKEMDPPRDLWSGIAEEIARQQAKPRVLRWAQSVSWNPAALATAAALIVAVAALLLSLGRFRGGTHGPESAAITGEQQAVSTGGEPHLQAAETDYLRATEQLMTALNQRRETLPPETQKVVDENLRTIDDALVQLRDALDKDPQNPKLNRMLASTYSKKVDFLRLLLKLNTRLPEGGNS
jgi:hypothetical protein